MSAVFKSEDIVNLCASTPVTIDHSTLLQKIARIYPELSFQHVLTRGGWHRTGGVVNARGERIAEQLTEWVETVADGHIEDLIDQYLDSDYRITTLRGETHYFVAETGSSAHDYVQLEVETLQEVIDRPLFDPDHLPDDLSDLIDPLDVERLTPEPIGPAVYDFRRMTAVEEYIADMQAHCSELDNRASEKLQRFMGDWDRSSARESGAFCRHWVLSLQEYTDAWGESIKRAKPVTTFDGDLSRIDLNTQHRGAELARLIHGFDHLVGYPMAWYFFMLSQPEVPYQLADAIHRDLMGAYDYLPARDLKIVQDWSSKPYGV